MEQYLSKVSSKGQYQYLDFFIWPSFQGVNRLFLLWYVGNHTSQVIEDTGFPLFNLDNVMIDEWNFFNSGNDIKMYKNIRKITTDRGDDCTIGCLLDYPYFKEHYEIIAIDLRNQQALDADVRAVQWINFAGNLDRVGSTIMVSILEEAKEIINFAQDIESTVIASKKVQTQ